MNKLFEHTLAIARGDVPPPPIARLLGFDIDSVKPGETLRFGPRRRTPILWANFTVRKEDERNE
jgi:hypothetical protein